MYIGMDENWILVAVFAPGCPERLCSWRVLKKDGEPIRTIEVLKNLGERDLPLNRGLTKKEMSRTFVFVFDKPMPCLVKQWLLKRTAEGFWWQYILSMCSTWLGCCSSRCYAFRFLDDLAIRGNE